MIFFTEKNNTLYITAKGHVTARFCAQLKDFVTEHLQEKQTVTDAYLEMKDCTYMDSTFIGVIAGINKQLKKHLGKKLHLQNVQKPCMELLDSMSLSSLLDFIDTPIEFPDQTEAETKEGFTKPEDIIEAHENLIELSDENKRKFSLLNQILNDSYKKN